MVQNTYSMTAGMVHVTNLTHPGVRQPYAEGFRILCSHYEPEIRGPVPLPCVIYLHGNSGWVVTPGVCQIGYMDHPGCHQLNVF
jgi:hypothetical protein